MRSPLVRRSTYQQAVDAAAQAVRRERDAVKAANRYRDRLALVADREERLPPLIASFTSWAARRRDPDDADARTPLVVDCQVRLPRGLDSPEEQEECARLLAVEIAQSLLMNHEAQRVTNSFTRHRRR